NLRRRRVQHLPEALLDVVAQVDVVRDPRGGDGQADLFLTAERDPPSPTSVSLRILCHRCVTASRALVSTSGQVKGANPNEGGHGHEAKHRTGDHRGVAVEWTTGMGPEG